MKLTRRESRSKVPRLLYQADPIRDSLKVLGRKWTLLILRDVAFLKIRRFGEMRQNNPGLTARVLSRRLRQMADEGLVRRKASGRAVYYDLTSRGEDAVYVLLALLRYGIRHHMASGGSQDPDEIVKRLHYDLPVKD
jgi:DNA-binding HxlR family transcriptional regulator